MQCFKYGVVCVDMCIIHMYNWYLQLSAGSVAHSRAVINGYGMEHRRNDYFQSYTETLEEKLAAVSRVHHN
jgi:hypothetical protein